MEPILLLIVGAPSQPRSKADWAIPGVGDVGIVQPLELVESEDFGFGEGNHIYFFFRYA